MLGITEGELIFAIKKTGTFKNKTIPQPHEPHKSNNRFLYSDVMRFIESLKPRFYASTSKSIIKALINMHSFEIQLSPIG